MHTVVVLTATSLLFHYYFITYFYNQYTLHQNVILIMVTDQKVRDFYGKLGILNDINNSCNVCFENPDQRAITLQLALDYLQGLLANGESVANVSLVFSKFLIFFFFRPKFLHWKPFKTYVTSTLATTKRRLLTMNSYSIIKFDWKRWSVKKSTQSLMQLLLSLLQSS